MPKKKNVMHYPVDHHPVHITYRLSGSIAVTALADLRKQKEAELKKMLLAQQQLAEPQRSESIRNKTYRINGAFEMRMDRLLHQRQHKGPYFLQRPELAKIVLDSWLHLHEKSEIYLYAVCVMSNHVHVILARPLGGEAVDLGNIMRRHKSFTAGQCNKVLGRTGLPFWDGNYYDRMIRAGWVSTAILYVLNNPVVQGLVERWEDWNYTWLHPDHRELYST